MAKGKQKSLKLTHSLPSHTYCQQSQHIAGLGSARLGASALALRVTASQLATALIDAQQLQESKHRRHDVFVFAVCFRCCSAETNWSCPETHSNGWGDKRGEFLETGSKRKVRFSFIQSAVPPMHNLPSLIRCTYVLPQRPKVTQSSTVSDANCKQKYVDLVEYQYWADI